MPENPDLPAIKVVGPDVEMKSYQKLFPYRSYSKSAHKQKCCPCGMAASETTFLPVLVILRKYTRNMPYHYVQAETLCSAGNSYTVKPFAQLH